VRGRASWFSRRCEASSGDGAEPVIGPRFARRWRLLIMRKSGASQSDALLIIPVSRSCDPIIRIIACLVGQITGSAPPSPRRHEGRLRDRHVTWCGLRWTLRRQVLLHRTKRPQRTAKSCGPGAATLASIPAGLCWRGNGDNKGRSPGRVRISRKAIARGKPGCPGCTCQIRVRFL
jgi:hypothetical protein